MRHRQSGARNFGRLVRATRSFVVRLRLPDALAPLAELAANLRWQWDQPTREVFAAVDPQAWAAGGHDPVRLLAMVSPQRPVMVAPLGSPE